MSFSFVKSLIVLNVLFAVALGLVAITKRWSARAARPLSYRNQLHFAYVLLATALIAPCFTSTPQSADFMPKTAQVWSAASMNTTAAPTPGDHHATISFATEDAGLSLSTIAGGMLVLCFVGLAASVVRVGAGVIAARRLIGRAQQIRRVDSLRVFVSEEIDVPFSFWLPGSRYIVVPASLILRAGDLRVALRHEGQHHRQGDTQLLYPLQLLRGMFFWNPAIHWLYRHVRTLQEFACDEAVAGRPDIAASDYCDTLLRVAQTALEARSPGVCTRMAGDRGSEGLLQRVQAILLKPKEYLQKPAVLAVNATAIIAIILTGIVLPGTVQDRRITLAQANAMAEVAREHSSFPIVVNAEVLEELNRLMGTPDGRSFMRASLQRMSAHELLVARQLEGHGLPSELLAVPILESGYRNLPADDNPRRGAGVWMFIAPTARQFGLTVDERRDDRLDLARETEAAMRYFSRLHQEFNDWPLTLLAYNAGSAKVTHGIRETGSRDAFHLTRSGYENDARYLPRLMAAVIVMRNADRLQGL